MAVCFEIEIKLFPGRKGRFQSRKTEQRLMLLRCGSDFDLKKKKKKKLSKLGTGRMEESNRRLGNNKEERMVVRVSPQNGRHGDGTRSCCGVLFHSAF